MTTPVQFTATIAESYGNARNAMTSDEAASVRVVPIIRLAFYLYCASIPFEIADRPIPLEIPTLAGCIFLLTTLLQPGICYRALPRGFWLLAAFFSVYVISSLLNGFFNPPELIKDFVRLGQLMVLLWAGYNVMRDPQIATAAVAALAVASLVRALLQVLGIGATATLGRVTVFDQDQNSSACIMGAGLLGFIGLTYGRSRSLVKPKFLIWPFVAIIIYAIVQTGSRGGLVAVVAGLFWFIFYGKDFRQILTNFCMATVAFLALVWGTLQSDLMRERLLESIREGKMSQREEIFPIFWDMFCEKPIIGWGPLSNNKESGRRMRLPGFRSMASHNLILDVLTATGLVGAVPFGIAVWTYVGCAWKARRGPHGILAFALFVSILVGNLSVDRLRSKLLWFGFMYSASCASFVAPGRKRLAVKPISGRASLPQDAFRVASVRQLRPQIAGQATEPG